MADPTNSNADKLLPDDQDQENTPLIGQAEKDHLDENLRLLFAQLEGLGFGADQITNMVENGILMDMDFYHTFIRIWQVMSYVVANGKSSDAQNPESNYDQAMSNGFFLPYFLTVFTLIPAAIGAYFAYKDIMTARKQNSTAYQLNEIKKVNPQTDITNEALLLDGYNDFLRREKVFFRAKLPSMTATPKAPEKKPLTTEVNVPLFGKVKVKTTYVNAAEKVTSFLASAWDKTVRASLIFWPIWFVGVLAIGITAVSVAPAAIIIAALSVGIAAIYFGVLSFLNVRKAKYALPKANDEEKAASKLLVDDLQRMRNEVKMRQHMKQDFSFFKRIFNIAKKEKPTNHVTPVLIATHEKKSGVIYFEKNPNASTAKAAFTPQSAANTPEKKKALLNSKLYKKLLGSKNTVKGRIVLNTAFEALGRYALTVFGLWLTAVVLGAVAMSVGGIIAAACTFVANVVGSGWTAFFFGITFGAFKGTQMYKQSKENEVARQKTIEARLSEPTSQNIPGIDNPTKAEAFEYFETSVDEKKKKLLPKLLAAQKLLQARVKKEGINALSDAEKVILNFKLKDIDVYNDHYFKTQQPESVWTKIRNVLSHGFRSLYSAQTGVLIVRTLFLAGGVVAAFFLLSPPVFIAVAAIVALTMGIAKAVQIYLNNKAEKSKFFVETIEARTSWLKKQDKKLDAIDNYLNDAKPELQATATALAMFERKSAPKAGVTKIAVPAYAAKTVDVVMKFKDASQKARASVAGMGLLSGAKKPAMAERENTLKKREALSA